MLTVKYDVDGRRCCGGDVQNDVGLPRQAQDTTFKMEVKIVAEKKETVAKMKELQRLWRKGRL